MALTAARIAELVDGELRGNPAIEVDAVASLDRAGPRHVSFLASAKYREELAATAAGVVLVDVSLVEMIASALAHDGRMACVVVRGAHDAVVALLPELYGPADPAPTIAPTARIGDGVQLGERVSVGEYVVIGDGCVIGNDTRLFSHATLYPGTVLGARCRVHSGARLGSDGFGYVFKDGAHQKIPHVGRCVIGDDVEIGANTTIDRGSIDDTVIGDGSKIDNLVHIAHNVRLGRGCLVMAQVGIAGVDACR